MFYLLLVIPHVVALAGLFAFAFYSNTTTTISEAADDEGRGDYGGGLAPPEAPNTGPSGGNLPLPHSVFPERRLQVGERLSDLHPRPVRREHEPERPQRMPVRH